MKRKALFVGVNRYEKLQPLKYCCSDAQALYDLFDEIGGYDELKPLFDPDLSTFRKTAESMMLDMSPGDFLFLYFSGCCLLFRSLFPSEVIFLRGGTTVTA